ncbi:MAG: hypothetical protein O3A49_05100 [Candidatus Marinimicrobia bacterium]|nr:hypothetical protein [Candidatus Neomarinimicrobiota bacterium]
MQKKHFITYGTNNFKLQQKELLFLVKKSGVFNTTHGYKPENLDINFKNKYQEILRQSRGGGYWIWKYKILQQKLNEINFNDILVYFDSGGSFNLGGKHMLEKYFEILNQSQHSLLQFRMNHLIEKNYTTKEIFEYFNVSNDFEIKNTGQHMGGLLFIKKTNDILEYLNLYENCIEYDPFLITDKYNKKQNNSKFIENRHDQSIFSVLSKKYGAEVVDGDPTYFSDKPSMQFHYPFLAVRRKKITKFEKIILWPKFYFGLSNTTFFKYKYSNLERIIYKISIKLYTKLYK